MSLASCESTSKWAGCCLVLALAAGGCTEPSVDESQLPQAIDRYIGPYVADVDFSGIIAVSRKSDRIVSGSYGYADFESLRKATEDDPFPIASVSKTFTAAAIRRLESQGVLSLEDPLERFLPSFPNGARITIRHLLAHQSGVPDYWSLDDAGAVANRFISLEDLVAWLGSQQLQFDPGSDSAYSNSGYALLAAVVEAAAGVKFHDYISDFILKPAGLVSTGEMSVTSAVVGYQPALENAGVARAVRPHASMLTGAGSLQSSASDLLTWCNNFNLEFNESTTPSLLYGWGAREGDGRRWVEQSGRTSGFAAHLRAYPDEQLCVVVMSNIESEAVNAIGSAVANMAQGQQEQPPARRNRFQVTAPLSEYAGHFGVSPQLVEVAVFGDELRLRGRNGVFLPLEPIAQDRFFYRQLYVEIHFERDKDQRVPALLWGGDYRMPRG